MKVSVFVTSLLTALVTSTAAYFVLNVLVPPPGRTVAEPAGPAAEAVASPGGAGVDVPNVHSLDAEQARTLLSERGLLLYIEAARDSADVAKGRVIEQSPLPGSRVKAHETVRVVLSAGSSKIQVPGLVGQGRAAATAKLEAAGLVVGQVQTQAGPQPKDVVLSHKPAAGAAVARGASVDLVVSAGPELVAVPKVKFKHVGVAERLLTEAGLKLGEVKKVDSDDYDVNVVVAQDPDGGAKVPAGTAVNLRIVRY